MLKITSVSKFFLREPPALLKKKKFPTPDMVTEPFSLFFNLQIMSTRHARTADRASNEKNAKVLKALLQKTPNKYCADCKKKGGFTLKQLQSALGY
jgi:hypothetical protein